ncbi:hypothetical protein LXL04_002153 [Taraxacum kok-saghyz]
MVLPNDVDLLNPPADMEKRKHKLKRLVQSPNSFFMVSYIFFKINPKLIELGLILYNFAITGREVPGLFSHVTQLYLAILKQWWYVETARRCCASRLVVVPDSLKDALSAGREIDRGTYFALS